MFEVIWSHLALVVWPYLTRHWRNWKKKRTLSLFYKVKLLIQFSWKSMLANEKLLHNHNRLEIYVLSLSCNSHCINFVCHLQFSFLSFFNCRHKFFLVNCKVHGMKFHDKVLPLALIIRKRKNFRSVCSSLSIESVYKNNFFLPVTAKG